MNLYLFALRENATDEQILEIEEALTPPVVAKVGNVPAWYGSDEDAWTEFNHAMKK